MWAALASRERICPRKTSAAWCNERRETSSAERSVLSDSGLRRCWVSRVSSAARMWFSTSDHAGWVRDVQARPGGGVFERDGRRQRRERAGNMYSGDLQGRTKGSHFSGEFGPSPSCSMTSSAFA